MSKLKLRFLTTFLIGALSGQAYGACELSEAPIIPDGNVASQDELLAAQKAMKAYQEVLLEYRTCIDGMSASIDLETEEGIAEKAVNDNLYDASVTAEESVAEQFNAAVRAFKSRGS